MWTIYWGNEAIHQPEIEDRRVQHGRLELSVTAAGCLTFDISEGHALYSSVTGGVRSKTPVTALQDGSEVFRGRISSVERDMIARVSYVTVEGELAMLNDSVIAPFFWRGKSSGTHETIARQYLLWLLAEHRKQGSPVYAGSVDYGMLGTHLAGESGTPKTTWDLIKEIAGDQWVRMRNVNGTRYLDIGWAGSTATQKLQLGLNILDLVDTTDSSQFFTAIYPYGGTKTQVAKTPVGIADYEVSERVTLKGRYESTFAVKGRGADLRITPSGFIYSSSLVSKYGWIARPVEFEADSVGLLLNRAIPYAISNIGVARSLDVSAVDLRNAGYTGFDRIRLGETVSIEADDITANMAVTEVSYDLDDPSNDTFTFGNLSNYTRRAASGNVVLSKTTNAADRALAEAEAAAASAGEKRRVFTSLPTPPYDEGDLWTNTLGDIKVCVTAKASGESYDAADWVKASDWTNDDLASTKNSTFRQDTPPAVAAEGDLWFDTDNGNRRYRYDGNGWVDVADEFVRTTERDAPVYTSGTVWDSVPATASTFWVPAEAANSLEISIGGALDRAAWPDLYSPIYGPYYQFEALPSEIRITGLDGGDPKTVTVTVPQPDQEIGEKRLRASYETASSGASLLSDELVLSRTQGAYILRRFGVEYPSMHLDEWIAGTGPWKSSDYTAVTVTDSISLPYMQLDLPALRPGTWNNAIAPSWATDATGGSGFAFVSSFAHPLELAYYDSPVYDEGGGTTGETERVLALNSFWSSTYQTNRDNLSNMTGEQRATLLNEQMFAAEVPDTAWKGWAVYYAASSTAAEVVDINWTWPALPPEPLDENGYYVEVVYPEGAGDSTRRVTARWDSGRTMDETYGMEPLTSSQINDIWDGA